MNDIAQVVLASACAGSMLVLAVGIVISALRKPRG